MITNLNDFKKKLNETISVHTDDGSPYKYSTAQAIIDRFYFLKQNDPEFEELTQAVSGLTPGESEKFFVLAKDENIIHEDENGWIWVHPTTGETMFDGDMTLEKNEKNLWLIKDDSGKNRQVVSKAKPTIGKSIEDITGKQRIVKSVVKKISPSDISDKDMVKHMQNIEKKADSKKKVNESVISYEDHIDMMVQDLSESKHLGNDTDKYYRLLNVKKSLEELIKYIYGR